MTGQMGGSARRLLAVSFALALLVAGLPGTNWTAVPTDPGVAAGDYALVQVAHGTAGAVAATATAAGATNVARLDTLDLVTARMTNARRLETRLIELLATRTGKLKDVLDVEQELARVREEIERYDGWLRYLRAHATMSTLSIYVHEPLPVVGHAGSSVIGEAFKQASRNFVGLVAAMIRSLGIVVPVAVLVAVLWVSGKRFLPPALRSAAR